MPDQHFFDIAALAATLPGASDTVLRDMRLTDEASASCRIFRTYQPAPMHFHTSCDEYLYVLSGRGVFVIEGVAPRELGPGDLVHFKAGTVHGMPQIVQHPFVVLAIDTPRRPPEDVHFVNPEDGTPQSFIATQTGDR